MKGINLLYDDFLTIEDDFSNLIEKMKRTLLTIPGERANRPDFGSTFKYFMFSDNKDFDRIEDVVKTDLEKWIPEIIVNNVTYEIDENKHLAKISIVFTEIDTGEEIEYNLSI